MVDRDPLGHLWICNFETLAETPATIACRKNLVTRWITCANGRWYYTNVHWICANMVSSFSVSKALCFQNDFFNICWFSNEQKMWSVHLTVERNLEMTFRSLIPIFLRKQESPSASNVCDLQPQPPFFKNSSSFLLSGTSGNTSTYFNPSWLMKWLENSSRGFDCWLLSLVP